MKDTEDMYINTFIKENPYPSLIAERMSGIREGNI